jgi:hypothetical protein
MDILKEHGEFVDWAVERLCYMREVTPMQVFKYLRDELGIHLPDDRFDQTARVI